MILNVIIYDLAALCHIRTPAFFTGRIAGSDPNMITVHTPVKVVKPMYPPPHQSGPEPSLSAISADP